MGTAHLTLRQHLSPRLAETAALSAAGLLDKQIASVMGITNGSVKINQSRARQKTGAKNKAELAAWWTRSQQQKTMPKVSLIVSTYHQPDKLACLLYALKVQTYADFEVLVADNSMDPAMLYRNASLVCDLNDFRFHHLATGPNDCYGAAEKLVPEAAGEYLGFPSDDGYYVPGFLDLMMKHNADLIYCDMVYDPRYCGKWAAIECQPKLGYIDKGGFLLRRKLFTRFPDDHRLADGILINELMARGISHAKAVGLLWVHN